jgi:hypothetical protein
LKRSLSFEIIVSKFVPLMVTDVPAVAIVGEKLVMVGPTEPDVMTKFVALALVPLGLVTLIVPVVDPEGTVTEIEVVVAAVIVAVVPLKLTESELVVLLNPVP